MEKLAFIGCENDDDDDVDSSNINDWLILIVKDVYDPDANDDVDYDDTDGTSDGSRIATHSNCRAELEKAEHTADRPRMCL